MDPQALMRVPALADLNAAAALADGANESDEDDDDDGDEEEDVDDDDDEQDNEGDNGPDHERPEAARGGDGGDAEGAPLLPRRRPALLLLRLAVFLALAWAGCMGAMASVLPAPLLVGRAVVAALDAPITHDPIVYTLGSLLLWRVAAAAAALRLHRLPAALARAAANAVAAVPASASLALRDGDRGTAAGERRRALLLRGAAAGGGGVGGGEGRARRAAAAAARAFAPHWAAARGASDWVQLVVLGCGVLPWLAGALLQQLLLRERGPEAAAAAAAAQGGFTAPAGWVAATATAGAAGGEESWTAAAAGWAAAAASGAAAAVARVPLEQTLARDWLLGALACGAVAQVLLLPGLVELPPQLVRAHVSLSLAIKSLVEDGDCHALLHFVLVPVVSELVMSLVPPLALSVALAGILCGAAAAWPAATGVWVAARAFAAPRDMLGVWVCARVAAAAWPAVSRALRKLLGRVHDTLRDERYLLGKRLFNLDEGERERRRRETHRRRRRHRV